MNKPINKKSLKPSNNVKKAIASKKQIEETLRQSEEKYRSFAENIAIGLFRSTPGPQGRFIEVNSALVQILGYKDNKELFKINISDIYQNSKDRLKFSNKISRKGIVKNEEVILRKKDGTSIIVSVTATAVRDQTGSILFFDGIIEDITQRKKTEEELHIQKTYLENLFNNAPEAIVLHDTNDLIADVNAEFTRMFGYSRKEAIGKPINELVASKEFQDEAAVISEKVIRGEKIELDTKRKRKDGTLIEVSILGAPIVHDGKQIGDYAIYRDITERKKVEEELLIQKTYLERLFNSAPEAIVLHDNNDRVVNINAEFTKMFGYSPQEAIGRHINDLVAPAELKEEAHLFSHMVVHGERVEADSIRQRKDGTQLDVWILGAPIIYEGKQIGVYAIYRDITERKKAEETRIRLKEEARMARNIQANFLPKSNPVIAGYDIAGMSLPALNVGGDYYDFIRLDDHRLAIGLGDVSGKGLPAALVMSNLQATIRGQTFFNVTVNQCLERANILLSESIDAKTFISLFYGILDTQKNTLCYANAGQNTPFLFSPGKHPLPLKTHGPALGMQRNMRYEKEEISIKPGDRLLIYSDGISEAMNDRMEEFGDEKVQEMVHRNNNDSASGLIDKIIAAANSHFGKASQNDDMTVIILKRKA